jgi:molybdopterin-containing oxidoreductase family iron-sulfur binding subunit
MERKYWKSLDAISATSSLTQDYSADMQTEFADGNADALMKNTKGMNRRSFIGVLSASMAFAATACRRPDHKIVPVVKASEFQIPGLPTYYTTVFSHGNAAIGLVAKTCEGRPIKLEGNDAHIASGGASSSWIQGSLLSLYDPDRMKNPFVNKGGFTPSAVRKAAPGFASIGTALSAIAEEINGVLGSGKSVRVLIGEHASPTFDTLLREIEATVGGLKFVSIPALYSANAAEANKQVLGIDAEFVVDYAQADVIVSIDKDFLGTDKNSVFNTRQFARNRKPSYQNPVMSKLTVVESAMSLTGMNADERVKASPQQYTAFLAAVAKGVGLSINSDDSVLSSEQKEAAIKVANELKAAQGKAVVVVGEHLSVAAHALGIAINDAVKAFGANKPINPAYQLPFSASKKDAITAFRKELKAGSVGAVIFAGVNPMYSADAEMQELLAKVERRFAFSMYEEETTSVCSVYVPCAHYLESWGDALAFDGSLSIQQPLVAPLNPNSASLPDLLLKLTKALKPESFSTLGESVEYVAYLRNRWENVYQGIGTNKPSNFDAFWAKVLRDGLIQTVLPSSPAISVNNGVLASLVSQEQAMPSSEFTALVMPSYAHYDGSLSNNSWFMELPDPVTKMTWDNAALMSLNTAKKLLGDKLANDIAEEAPDYDNTVLIRLKSANGVIELPVWVQPGMQDGVIATTTGFGRTKVGEVANNVGANAYVLMSAEQSFGYVPVTVEVTGKKYRIATTQKHTNLIGRKLALETSFAKIQAKDKHLFEKEHVPGKKTHNNDELPPSILPNFAYKGHRWGMTIDMSACVGCGACITACQAENNIPVVGKENVMNARDMHWIRIDRYYDHSNLENPNVTLQPMLCQHCENAPCENVCPVAATTHSPEGLNEMTYNRCVGTKYCANNCPYKVRRFNWLNFHKGKRTPLEFVHNPDVTVRMRGVMEKCSFCTQRIAEARQKAKDAGELYIQDGAVQTACQQACPAAAITFGNTNDAESIVSKSRASERGFLVLEELNVRPQITYLAKVRNQEGKKNAAGHSAEHHG